MENMEQETPQESLDPSDSMEDAMDQMHQKATTETGHLGEHPCCTKMDYRIPPQ